MARIRVKSFDLEENLNLGAPSQRNGHSLSQSKKTKWWKSTYNLFLFFLVGLLLYFLTFIRSISYLNELEEKVHWKLPSIRGSFQESSPDVGLKVDSVCSPNGWTVEEKVGALNLGCEDIEDLKNKGWKKISEGYWRDVFLTEWEGKPIVVKYMKPKHKESARNLDRHKREAITLGILHKSKNIVKLVGYCDYHVATQWMPLSLEDVIFSSKLIPYKHVLKIALGVAKGIRDVHQIAGGPVVHADIQPRQFMIDYDGTIKINDFNRCRFIEHDQYGGKCPFKIKSHNGKWRSPEEYTDNALLTEKIDIYSIGLILWSLLSKETPYSNFTNTQQQQDFVMQGGRPPLHPSWPKPYVKLIETCWDPDPRKRPQGQTMVNKLTKMLNDYEKMQSSDDGFRYDFTKGQNQLSPELYHLTRKLHSSEPPPSLRLAPFQLEALAQTNKFQNNTSSSSKHSMWQNLNLSVAEHVAEPKETLVYPKFVPAPAPGPVPTQPQVEAVKSNTSTPSCIGEDWWKDRPEGPLGCKELEHMKNTSIKISHGYFREAYHGLWGTQDVCLKYLRDTQDEKENINRHRREAVALAKVRDNPNVIQFLGRCHNNIYTEWMPLRLDNLIFKNQEITIPYIRVLKIALDMARGLKAFHEVEGGPIAHTDIQLKQFLIDYDGTVKLGDLNRAKFVSHTEKGQPCTWTSSINKGRWRSPEEYTPKARLTEMLDIYSLGLSFWALLSRKKPFSEYASDEVPVKVRDLKIRPEMDSKWQPPAFLHLIREMWDEDPMKRPTAGSVVRRLETMVRDNHKVVDDFQYEYPKYFNETVSKALVKQGKEFMAEIESTCNPPSWFDQDFNNQIPCTEIEGLRDAGTLLGEGYWRDVFLTEREGQKIVVKWMKSTHKMSTRNKDRHSREAKVLNQLVDHPQVVQLLAYCDYHVVTEWLPLSLDAVLYNEGGRHPHIPLMWKLKIALDVAKGLEALHNLPEGPIAHTDIQSRQFLVDYEGTVKINDFNRCRLVMHHGETGEACPFYVSVNGGYWRAPEEYSPGHALDEKLDIYSTSLIFWGLLSRRQPYNDIWEEENMKAFVLKGGRPKIKSHWNKEFVQLIQDMWAQRPEDRPTATEVVQRLTNMLENYTATADDLAFKFDYGIYSKNPKQAAAARKAELVQSIDDAEGCFAADWWYSQPEGELSCTEISALKQFGKKIGEGYWRDIYAMNYNGSDLAIKYMKNDHEHSKRNIDRHLRESIALSLVGKHPNVVHFLGRCNFDVATEYMPLGLDRIVFNKTLTPDIPLINMYSMALDVAKGVEAIHTVPEGPIVHADIQTKQFLLDDSGTVRINDLNRCRFTPHKADGSPCPFYIYDHGGKWRSPEEYTPNQPLNEKIDIYSMGIVLWTLISREYPFHGVATEDAQKLVMQGDRPFLREEWPAEYSDLLRELWHQEPPKRPSATETVERLSTMLAAEVARYKAQDQDHGSSNGNQPSFDDKKDLEASKR